MKEFCDIIQNKFKHIQGFRESQVITVTLELIYCLSKKRFNDAVCNIKARLRTKYLVWMGAARIIKQTLAATGAGNI